MTSSKLAFHAIPEGSRSSSNSTFRRLVEYKERQQSSILLEELPSISRKISLDQNLVIYS